MMKNQADYSLYKCPYSHIEKDCGHELHGPEGYENTYGVWCACGFRGPVLCLDPSDLKLEKKDNGIVTVKRLYEEEKKANKPLDLTAKSSGAKIPGLLN